MSSAFLSTVPKVEPAKAPYKVQRQEACFSYALATTLPFIFGFSALWIYLSLVETVYLVRSGFPSSDLSTFSIAGLLALILSLGGFALMLPWLIVILITLFMTPPESPLCKWWVGCPLAMLAGIAAWWVEGLLFQVLCSGSLSGINLSLMLFGSGPAAVLAGATCFGAAQFRQLVQGD